MSCSPARILGLNKGHLGVGADADITLIDPDRQEIIDVNKFASKGKNSPFGGWKLTGLPVATIVGGRVVMRDRELVL
ncbi:MAG: amidohydrolase family protein [Firmicutes bacterium]|nr:amidohydrolase family protein [Bacillota bacterium]